MNKQENDIALFNWFRKRFKKSKYVTKGQLGIYNYIWACDTIHEDSSGFKFDINAKIKVLETYEDVVEVEVLDIKINDSASQDIINIITKNFPKYIDPKYIKWQIIPNNI